MRTSNNTVATSHWPTCWWCAYKKAVRGARRAALAGRQIELGSAANECGGADRCVYPRAACGTRCIALGAWAAAMPIVNPLIGEHRATLLAVLPGRVAGSRESTTMMTSIRAQFKCILYSCKTSHFVHRKTLYYTGHWFCVCIIRRV
jgi:hypothetical protein